MPTIGFCKESSGSYLVGAEDAERKYKGPVAEVGLDKTWLTICTDPYDGSAMLNAEALPFLIEALQRLAQGIDTRSDETAQQAQPEG